MVTVRTVTLNPAIDVFRDGDSVNEEPAGKGINVARHLYRLSLVDHTAARYDIKAYGFEGGENGEKLKALMDAKGVPYSFVNIDGDTRVTHVLSPHMGGKKHTQAPMVTMREYRELREMLYYETEGGDIVVFAGSVPLGLTETVYRDLIGDMKDKWRVNTYLDASQRGPLLEGLKAGPTCAKPNRQEFMMMSGPEEAENLERVAGHARRSLVGRYGMEFMLISLDRDGAIYASRRESIHVPAPEVKVENITGPGDALLSGFIHGRLSGMMDAEVLKLAVSLGSAHVCREGNTELDLALADRLSKGVEASHGRLF